MSGYILRDIRQAWGMEPNDDSQDKLIMELFPDKQFELYCQWNGLLGWSNTLKNVVLELFKEE